MFQSRASHLTMSMIYGGTFLLSILSFITTFLGLRILLDFYLALIGSLGLQIAMLGIAWNLMKIRDKRPAYVIVFITAASFSIFFSYANFDSALKGNTRMYEARSRYADSALPILAGYTGYAKNALVQGEYQVNRLEDLVQLEKLKGWTTVVDEGSGDLFIQAVIDGARSMVESWNTHQGQPYNQGRGRGIIADYLESQLNHARSNVIAVDRYVRIIDSLKIEFSGDLPVGNQYEIVNTAWADFPSATIASIIGIDSDIPLPPDKSRFIENPTSRQQAFRLVIDDLMRPDRLTIFSVLLAIAIDLIIVLMALVASFAVDTEDRLLDRIRKEAALKIDRISLDNADELETLLKNNIDRLERARDYRERIKEVLHEFDARDGKFRLVLNRSAENKPDPAHESSPDKNMADKPDKKRRVIVI